jgi:hypothetical protein
VAKVCYFLFYNSFQLSVYWVQYRTFHVRGGPVALGGGRGGGGIGYAFFRKKKFVAEKECKDTFM